MLSRFRWYRRLRGGVWFARYYWQGNDCTAGAFSWEQIPASRMVMVDSIPAWCEDWRSVEERALWRLGGDL